MGIKFGGLKLQKKPESSRTSKPAAKSVFGDDPLEDEYEDENEIDEVKSEDEDILKTAKKWKLKLPDRVATRMKDEDDLAEKLNARQRVNTELVAQSIRNSELSATQELQDPSVYAYDEVYDTMKSAERDARTKFTKNEDKTKSKYIESLHKSTEARQRDRLLARDTLNKRERESEGDEFADKEVFVTSAYKKQKAEVEKLKAEEEAKEEAEKKSKRKGLTSIYHKVLSQAENTHDAAVRAAAASATTKDAKSDHP
ncbi:coiled-coil domain-containing protein 55-domain containing protein [Dipodascopsis uninucleata]